MYWRYISVNTLVGSTAQIKINVESDIVKAAAPAPACLRSLLCMFYAFDLRNTLEQNYKQPGRRLHTSSYIEFTPSLITARPNPITPGSFLLFSTDYKC
ncbi:unnamed protein product [Leptosia nina]|uniref:Uncharacterized protein n=1 Tax=Leptosia nina TaxID=320188 RepID=A0AAV1JDA7_9NEOP